MNKLSDKIIDVSSSICTVVVSLLFIIFDLLVLFKYGFNLKYLFVTLFVFLVLIVQIITLKYNYNKLKQAESENILNFDYMQHRVKQLEEIISELNRGL